ncbi:MAG TPA: hypothetical protein VFQ35_10840 [Polyangiaceae bacterium]|nr:hypothetical protein [Polyangiaceae bacterium]
MSTRFILSNSSHVNSRSRLAPLLGSALIATLAAACSGSDATDVDATQSEQSLRAVIGAEGGELVGKAGTVFEGVRLSIPRGALVDKTEIEIVPATHLNPLPTSAVGCGPEFEILPAGLKLDGEATLTLPFNEQTISDHYRFDDEVKVWAVMNGKWGQLLQTESSEGSVTVALQELNGVGAGINPPADSDIVKFDFAPNPKFAKCLARYPEDPSRAPHVSAVVVRGELNDGLFLRGENVKPNLKFDMFSVERSSLLADATPDPNFKGFGLAWYQSDLEANSYGRMNASIRTILLDQIFGFDPDVTLAPTGTFQMGFWFNNPDDAAECGFDVTKPTPFNGEHRAGPLAMISLPNEETGLGPLCTKPDTSVSPARCDP